jgi:hypothetical protein
MLGARDRPFKLLVAARIIPRDRAFRNRVPPPRPAQAPRFHGPVSLGANEVDVPFDVRVWRRLRVIEKLSLADRAAVIKYAEALARGAGVDGDTAA